MEQLAMVYERPRWGGAREGSGPRKSSRRMPHGRREELAGRFPLHVTWGMDRRVWNLRSGRAWKALRPALEKGAERFGGRLVEFSVMGNHIHLLVEATGREALGRAMRALGIRIARAMNRLMGAAGRVIGDRYHARVLKTPAEVRAAIRYVRNNFRKHAAEWGTVLPREWRDPFASAEAGVELARPVTWLLTMGLRRARE
jgi:REP element-mobilizing transposase RayT